jgi:hypothetical protein
MPMSVRDRLIGTWDLIDNTNERDGVRTRPFGDPPVGQLMLDGAGRVSVFMSEPNLPMFLSGNRLRGTDAENKRVVQGCLSVVGTYELLEGESTLILVARASTYPNLVGVPMRRPFRLDGSTQTWNVTESTIGGSSVIVWKRASH